MLVLRVRVAGLVMVLLGVLLTRGGVLVGWGWGRDVGVGRVWGPTSRMSWRRRGRKGLGGLRVFGLGDSLEKRLFDFFGDRAGGSVPISATRGFCMLHDVGWGSVISTVAIGGRGGLSVLVVRPPHSM